MRQHEPLMSPRICGTSTVIMLCSVTVLDSALSYKSVTGTGAQCTEELESHIVDHFYSAAYFDGVEQHPLTRLLTEFILVTGTTSQPLHCHEVEKRSSYNFLSNVLLVIQESQRLTARHHGALYLAILPQH